MCICMRFHVFKYTQRQTHTSRQTSICLKPEFRGFGEGFPYKPPFKMISAEVVIICPDTYVYLSIFLFTCMLFENCSFMFHLARRFLQIYAFISMCLHIFTLDAFITCLSTCLHLYFSTCIQLYSFTSIHVSMYASMHL